MTWAIVAVTVWWASGAAALPPLNEPDAIWSTDAVYAPVDEVSESVAKSVDGGDFGFGGVSLYRVDAEEGPGTRDLLLVGEAGRKQVCRLVGIIRHGEDLQQQLRNSLCAVRM